jgi:hypothetical protein
MPISFIEDIVVHGLDASGNEVTCIYAKKPPEYLVYRDPARVMIHFADNGRVARRQRTALAVLNPLRGQISGLIDGWHSSDDPTKQARAARYERRVADAVSWDWKEAESDAVALLGEIRGDVVAERRSMAGTDYLLVAALAGAAILLFHLFAQPRVGPERRCAGPGRHLDWGIRRCPGAFFSIAIGLRSRSILIDLQQWDNRRDAILRIAVGTIGGSNPHLPVPDRAVLSRRH